MTNKSVRSPESLPRVFTFCSLICSTAAFSPSRWQELVSAAPRPECQAGPCAGASCPLERGEALRREARVTRCCAATRRGLWPTEALRAVAWSSSLCDAPHVTQQRARGRELASCWGRCNVYGEA